MSGLGDSDGCFCLYISVYWSWLTNSLATYLPTYIQACLLVLAIETLHNGKSLFVCPYSSMFRINASGQETLNAKSKSDRMAASAAPRRQISQ